MTSLITEFNDNRRDSSGILDEQYRENRIASAFYAGDSTLLLEKLGLDNEPLVQFNRTKPFISSVQGFMAQNRRKAKYEAINPDDMAQDFYSQHMNASADYFRNRANADQVETQQDLDLLIAGYGAVDTELSFGLGQSDRDPNGDIIMERIDPNFVGWDVSASQRNLLDARYVWREIHMHKEEASDLYDRPEDDFEEANADGDSADASATAFEMDMIYGTENLVRVFKYEYYLIKDYYSAANPLYGMNPQSEMVQRILLDLTVYRNMKKKEGEDDVVDNLFDFNPTNSQLVVDAAIRGDIEAIFSNYGIEVDFTKHKKREYRTALITGTTLLKDFRSLDQQGFSIKFKTADYDPINKRWFGIVSQLMEPNLYYNKTLTEMLRIIASNAKGGVMYEESAVNDVNKFEQSWADDVAATEVADGALTNGRIQPKKVNNTATGYETIFGITDGSFEKVTGIDKGFLGSSENMNEPAALQRARIKQVTTVLAVYFDSITLYQREHARMLMTYIRKLARISQGRMIRILGADGARQWQQLSADYIADQFEVDVEESPDSAFEKQEKVATLTQLADKMALVGNTNVYAVITPMILRLMDFPAQEVAEITKAMQPPPPDPQAAQAQAQAQALQQAMLELGVQEKQVDIKKKQQEIGNLQAEMRDEIASAVQRIADANKKEQETRKSSVDTTNAVLQRFQQTFPI